MLKFFTKKLKVPESNELKEVEVVQLWEVRWHSPKFYCDCRLVDHKPELECFLSKKEAQDFAESLENAYELIRSKNHGTVTIQKAATPK